MSYPQMRQQSGPIAGYPDLRASNADTSNLSKRILSGLEAIAQRFKAVLTIFSGYRSPTYSASVGGYANDPHSRGVGADVNVGGQSLGGYLRSRGADPVATLAAVGLESGDQPGFYRGSTDPSHVQVPGSGVNKGVVDYGTAAAGPETGSAWRQGVPAELASAIDQAAGKYHVSPSLLAGIWRVESGSSYPNPYVNSSGYGGLFGTGEGSYRWSTQRQADYAAQTLSKLIQANGGDVAAALRQYSGGGYSSVPGGGSAAAAPAGSEYQSPARPGGGDGNQYASVTGTLEDAYRWSNPALIGKGVWDFVGGKGITDVGSGLKSIVGFFAAAAWLLHPKNWLRMFEALLGVGMIMYGLAYFGKGDGPDVRLRSLASTNPAKIAGDAAEGGGAAVSDAPKAVLSKTQGKRLIDAKVGRGGNVRGYRR